MNYNFVYYPRMTQLIESFSQIIDAQSQNSNFLLNPEDLEILKEVLNELENLAIEKEERIFDNQI